MFQTSKTFLLSLLLIAGCQAANTTDEPLAAPDPATSTDKPDEKEESASGTINGGEGEDDSGNESGDFALGQSSINSLRQLNQGADGPVFAIAAGKLFVADSNNHRVLVWNSIPSSSGAAADFALGQPDLASNTANNGGLSAGTFNSPQSVYSNGTKLFVVDTGNHRVLVWNSIPSSSGAAADFALGQPDLVSNTGNNGGISGGTLNYPRTVCGDGTRLFVTDSLNHRVLVWNALPTSSGAAADFALGQPDLVSNTLNNGGISGGTMKTPYGAFSDGTRLFVAEYGNHRVLVWNTLPTSSGELADFALGQPDLVSNTANNSGISGGTLNSPSGIYSDGTRLFVADQSNHRVLVWNTLPSSSGELADFALGQPNLASNTSNNGGISGGTLNYPRSVYSNGTKLFVVDYSNHRVLVWNTLPTSSGELADFALNQPDLVSNTSNNGGLSGGTMKVPHGVYSDGTRLFVADTYNNRVLVWNSIPSSSGTVADFALGQPDLVSNTVNNGGLSGGSMYYPTGIYSDGSRLFVVDNRNHRVLVWNSLPSSSGTAADFALGQPDLVSNTVNNGGLSGGTMNYPFGIYSDGTKLFVAESSNNRVLVWNSLPTSSGAAANFALGQPDLVSSSQNNGGLSGGTLKGPSGVYSNGTKLFVADSGNNRVLVWNILPTNSGAAADFALGQPDLASNTSNNGGLSGESMNYPIAVYCDSSRLYVADANNHRVLVWNSLSSSAGTAADFALGQPDLVSNTGNNGGLSGETMKNPYGIHSDGTSLFIADAYNHRVLVLDAQE